MSTTPLSQDQYIAERKRETRRHRGIARAQLASARGEYAIRATPERRAKLVRCLATLYIAEAFCAALEDV